MNIVKRVFRNPFIDRKSKVFFIIIKDQEDNVFFKKICCAFGSFGSKKKKYKHSFIAETIEHIDTIQDNTGIHKQQQLIFARKQLKDGRALSDANVSSCFYFLKIRNLYLFVCLEYNYNYKYDYTALCLNDKYVLEVKMKSVSKKNSIIKWMKSNPTILRISIQMLVVVLVLALIVISRITHYRLVSTNINTDNRPRPSDIAKDDDKPKTKGKEIQESDNYKDRNSIESLQSNTSSSSVSSVGFEDRRSGLQNATTQQNEQAKSSYKEKD
ncbi:hypothetical protein RFI_29618 [Reticulomyxa filosa]|uniref:Transmembrane protein n=1 Tax=Reticulomyxa filosa TaxID=46433 RepID=X6M2U1_RETFI|nr:hypothetical protein RFI_29618 [Reticulomyxa filosa]|eukprot:ETO07772.1 hypothetical protein RFI_29618 [Reticulomyxa filosa]